MTPALSIIIPVYNNWALTKSCLDSLSLSLVGVEFEVIVVDNGSYDGTAGGLGARGDVVVVRHERNLGFARACNAGAERARAPTLLFLNNDMRALPGALARMQRSFVASPSIGVLGARLLYADYTVQHAGMVVDEAGDWHHVFRGLPGEHPLVLIKRSFQAVTGACLMINRELFSSLHGFDIEFLNSHEDVDLCLRVRAGGREVVYDPSVAVLHFESMSAGRSRAHAKGAALLRKKWGALPADALEHAVTFPQKVAAGLDAEIRALLESERSPWARNVADWDADDDARRYRELVRARALCEPFTQHTHGVRGRVRQLFALARDRRGLG